MSATPVTFYDNFIPTLPDGEYTIKISQQLTVNVQQTQADGGNINVDPSPQPDLLQKFMVRGPRFVLTPADVHRVFPGANSSGMFQPYLPMIVFNKRSLPWERRLNISAQQKKQPGNYTDAKNYPWMALMVFSADELSVPQPLSGPAPPLPEGSQANPAITASFAINEVVHASFGGKPTNGPPARILGPTIVLQDDEDPATTFCNVIDVPAANFKALIPTLNDMRFLTHVREVSSEHKEPIDTSHDGWFSIAITNRFSITPAAGSPQGAMQKNIVHLVSLEGLEPYLDGTTPLDGYDKVRFISLYNWTFGCLAAPQENFRELMLNLIDPDVEQQTGLLMRMPMKPAMQSLPDSGSKAVYSRLKNGYTALSYGIRTGEQTFAWYRGPFSPVPVTPFLDTTDPLHPTDLSAPGNTSEAMVFDPSTGLFDQSYSVAFQTGRSLALASQAFSTNLLQWRRDAHGLVDRLAESVKLPALHGVHAQAIIAGNDADDLSVSGLAKLLRPGAAHEPFKRFLAAGFKKLANNITAEPKPELLTNALTLADEQPKAHVTPAVLLQLTKAKPVVSLLSHLSGLATIGTTAQALAGNLDVVLLQSGASIALDTGSSVSITSPDGKITAVVAAAAPVAKGGTSIRIINYSFLTALPAGSTVQLSDIQILPAQVIEWLARKSLLYDVPFNNLVPGIDLLPQEAIRFFYIDQNWINALIDGALSVGVQSSRDNLLQQLMRTHLQKAVLKSSRKIRGTLLRSNKNALLAAKDLSTDATGAKGGFVLRSPVVQQWPGLEVKAWSATDATTPMTALRIDRVAPDILVAIFPDIPVQVQLNEPSEGLVFGVEDEGIELRYIPGVPGTDASKTGFVMPDPGKQGSRYWLTPAEIAKTKRAQPAGKAAMMITGDGSLVNALQQKLNGKIPLSPASFAVEMVRVPQQMLFLTKKTVS